MTIFYIGFMIFFIFMFYKSYLIANRIMNISISSPQSNIVVFSRHIFSFVIALFVTCTWIGFVGCVFSACNNYNIIDGIRFFIITK